MGYVCTAILVLALSAGGRCGSNWLRSVETEKRSGNSSINFELYGEDGEISEGPSGILVAYNGNGAGTVCDDYFDEVAAKVVCKSMGYGGVKWWGNNNNGTYDDGIYMHNASIVLDNIQCSSGASSFEFCSHNGWGNHNCGHHEDVVLECSMEEECEDVYSNCGYYANDLNECCEGSWIDWMAINCPVACGTCNNGTANCDEPTEEPTEDECEDSYTGCYYWANNLDECCVGSWIEWMAVYCPVTCGTCNNGIADCNNGTASWL